MITLKRENKNYILMTCFLYSKLYMFMYYNNIIQREVNINIDMILQTNNAFQRLYLSGIFWKLSGCTTQNSYECAAKIQ